MLLLLVIVALLLLGTKAALLTIRRLPSRPAAEARGDYAAAMAAYRLALRLLLARRDPEAIVQQPGTADGTDTSLQTGRRRAASMLAPATAQLLGLPVLRWGRGRHRPPCSRQLHHPPRPACSSPAEPGTCADVGGRQH